MIYPSGRAVYLALIGAPFALLIAVLLPSLWFLGLGWAMFIVGLTVADGLLAPSPGSIDLRVEGPAHMSVGGSTPVMVRMAFSSAIVRPPSAVGIAIGVSPLLTAPDSQALVTIDNGGVGAAAITVQAIRRGTGVIERVWGRWQGPFGLAWIQRVTEANKAILITPDIRPVRQTAASLFQRSAMHGLLAQLDRGDGTEYEALLDFRTGMDRRSIDWKQSARHVRLLAKEYRPERNNIVIFALDTGRTMCEPVAGVPRIDRAVSAALVSAYIALKLGDRVGLFGFDARPRLASGAVSGTRAFSQLQRAAASLDYSTQETNYTLALTTLDGHLNRRAMVVIFTEFADAVSAELMLRALGGVLARHHVVFVMLKDAELEAVAAAEPFDVADVARAVTAADMLRARRLVMSQLTHAGVHVIEAPHDRVAVQLADHYIDAKRRNLL